MGGDYHVESEYQAFVVGIYDIGLSWKPNYEIVTKDRTIETSLLTGWLTFSIETNLLTVPIFLYYAPIISFYEELPSQENRLKCNYDVGVSVNIFKLVEAFLWPFM